MQTNSLFTSVLVVAAGRGTRMNSDINKQYIDIGDIPVIAKTLAVFQNSNDIDEIIVVINENDISYCQKNIIEKYSLSKVKKLVPGGKERQNSVYNGLINVNPKSDIVLIHDGARPFINENIIKDSIRETFEFGATIVAVSVKDTIKEGDSEGFISKTLDRSNLWSVQTPQGFRYDLILEAHNKAIKDGFLGTDDAVLVERLGTKIKIVFGSYDNIKITTQEDLAIAEAICAKK